MGKEYKKTYFQSRNMHNFVKSSVYDIQRKTL